MGAPKLDQDLLSLSNRLDALEKKVDEGLQKRATTILLFHDSLDKALAAFNIANASAASGLDTTIFVTFWGVSAFRKSAKVKKSLIERMFGWMLPTGSKKLSLSKMHMMGMGTGMMKGIMKSHGVPSLEESIEIASELGVKIILCEMTMELMGISRDEIIDYEHLEYAGAASFVDVCSEGKISMAL